MAFAANFKYKLAWRGKLYEARYSKALREATYKAGIEVKNEAKELLNVSGKAGTAKAGLNRLSKKESRGLSNTQINKKVFDNGFKKISGLKTVEIKKNQFHFGGSFSHKDKKTGKTVQLDRIYWYGEPLHRWVQASQPGSPPHKQTGNLQKIVVEPFNKGMAVKVGPQHGLIYARIQELGGKKGLNLAARPYMSPALQQAAQRIRQIFRQKVKSVT